MDKVPRITRDLQLLIQRTTMNWRRTVMAQWKKEVLTDLRERNMNASSFLSVAVAGLTNSGDGIEVAVAAVLKAVELQTMRWHWR